MYLDLFENLDRALKRVGGQRVRRVFVALSGGADSLALLHCVSEHLAGQIIVQALHADHQLHAQSAQWAQACGRHCEELQVPLTVEALAVSAQGNTEAAARAARYEFFCRHLTASDVLMLAHHRQDQAETLLMRLLQGRGVLPMRDHGRLAAGQFVRPFLDTDKNRLLDYLRSKKVQWVEDPSNQDTAYDRNYLRHAVLPVLQERWPDFAARLQHSAQGFTAQRALLDFYLQPVPDQVALSQLPSPAELGLAWLRVYLAQRGEYRVADAALTEFLRQTSTAERAKLDLDAATLHVWRDSLYFERAADCTDPQWLDMPVEPPTEFVWHQQGFMLRPAEAGAADAFAYSGELYLTSRDRLSQQGARAVASLKKHFQQAGIPPWRRPHYPLLWDAHGLVAIAGVWQRPQATLTPNAAIRYCTLSWRAVTT